MTDRIDLDKYATDSDESDDTNTANHGDWFWRETGDPTAEPPAQDAQELAGNGDVPDEQIPTGTQTSTATAKNGHDETTTESINSTDTTIPRVPRENDDKPVGIPVEQDGAGGASAGEHHESTAETAGSVASGPHGGGVDDMTLAFTYEAAKCLAEPQHAFADAGQWADWVGIVGHTEAHVLNTFQRRNYLDLDFFNGTGTGPGERLTEIDEHSMFFAERMVVVGRDNEAEIAETANWEFVPLQEAATKADWELDE